MKNTLLKLLLIYGITPSIHAGKNGQGEVKNPQNTESNDPEQEMEILDIDVESCESLLVDVSDTSSDKDLAESIKNPKHCDTTVSGYAEAQEDFEEGGESDSYDVLSTDGESVWLDDIESINSDRSVTVSMRREENGRVSLMYQNKDLVIQNENGELNFPKEDEVSFIQDEGIKNLKTAELIHNLDGSLLLRKNGIVIAKTEDQSLLIVDGVVMIAEEPVQESKHDAKVREEAIKEKKIRNEVIPNLRNDFIEIHSKMFNDYFWAGMHNMLSKDLKYCIHLLEEVETCLKDSTTELKDKVKRYNESKKIVKESKKSVYEISEKNKQIISERIRSETEAFELLKKSIDNQILSEEKNCKTACQEQQDKLTALKTKIATFLEAKDKKLKDILNKINDYNNTINKNAQEYTDAKKKYENAVSKNDGKQDAEKEIKDKNLKELENLKQKYEAAKAKHEKKSDYQALIEQENKKHDEEKEKKHKGEAVYTEFQKKLTKQVEEEIQKIKDAKNAEVEKFLSKRNEEEKAFNEKIEEKRNELGDEKHKKQDAQKNAIEANAGFSFKDIELLKGRIRSLERVKKNITWKKVKENILLKIWKDIDTYRNKNFCDAMIAYIANPKRNTRMRALSKLNYLSHKMYLFVETLKFAGLCTKDDYFDYKKSISEYKKCNRHLLAFDRSEWINRFILVLKNLAQIHKRNQRPEGIENYQSIGKCSLTKLKGITGMLYEVEKEVSLIQKEGGLGISLEVMFFEDMKVVKTITEKFKEGWSKFQVSVANAAEKGMKNGKERIERRKEITKESNKRKLEDDKNIKKLADKVPDEEEIRKAYEKMNALNENNDEVIKKLSTDKKREFEEYNQKKFEDYKKEKPLNEVHQNIYNPYSLKTDENDYENISCMLTDSDEESHEKNDSVSTVKYMENNDDELGVNKNKYRVNKANSNRLDKANVNFITSNQSVKKNYDNGTKSKEVESIKVIPNHAGDDLFLVYGGFFQISTDYAKINDSWTLNVGLIGKYDSAASSFVTPLFGARHKSGWALDFNLLGILTKFNCELRIITPFYFGISLAYDSEYRISVRIVGCYNHSFKFTQISGYSIPLNVGGGAFVGGRKG